MHVAAVLVTLQVLGQTVLGFRLSVAQILICLATGALIEFVVVFFKDSAIMWPASGLLTGNSAAFILRTPGTLHGQWWSLNKIWVFVGVVAISMASKYLIRWRGRHIFNPSNLGLVLAFVALGPKFTEPQDLWWIPPGPWLIVTYAVLVVGGLLIAWELRLLGLELAFMAGFAAFTALALALVPDHCMVASWHVAPMCGRELWQILVTSPELLVFGLFMLPDPRTVPDGPVARVAFGILVAILRIGTGVDPAVDPGGHHRAGRGLVRSVRAEECHQDGPRRGPRPDHRIRSASRPRRATGSDWGHGRRAQGIRRCHQAGHRRRKDHPEDLQLRQGQPQPLPAEVQQPGVQADRRHPERHEHLHHQGRVWQCALAVHYAVFEELGSRHRRER